MCQSSCSFPCQHCRSHRGRPPDPPHVCQAPCPSLPLCAGSWRFPAGAPGWWRRVSSGPIPSPWVRHLDMWGPSWPQPPTPLCSLRIQDGAVPDAASGTLTSGPAVSSAYPALAFPLQPGGFCAHFSVHRLCRAVPGHRRALPRHLPAVPGSFLLSPHWTPGPLLPVARSLLGTAPLSLPPVQHHCLPQRLWHPALHGGKRTAGVRPIPGCSPSAGRLLGAKPLSPHPRLGSFFRLVLCTNHTCHL